MEHSLKIKGGLKLLRKLFLIAGHVITLVLVLGLIKGMLHKPYGLRGFLGFLVEAMSSSDPFKIIDTRTAVGYYLLLWLLPLTCYIAAYLVKRFLASGKR